jgi:Fur family ferric uptake transcriptional regulator
MRADTLDLEKAAQNALQSLQALGYQGLRLDVSVRGLCLDCATPAPAATA